jgi:hypothetical protein
MLYPDSIETSNIDEEEEDGDDNNIPNDHHHSNDVSSNEDHNFSSSDEISSAEKEDLDQDLLDNNFLPQLSSSTTVAADGSFTPKALFTPFHCHTNDDAVHSSERLPSRYQ